MGLTDLTATERAQLMHSIAAREGTANEIATWYTCTTAELKEFVAANRQALTGMQERIAREEEAASSAIVTPTQLDELWITQKFERLKRYQDVADILYEDAKHNPEATNLRELRAYMQAVANELGQLLHRGSGDAGTGDTLSVDIQGIDMDNLR